ncbi:MAG: EAL domain-containing protein [Betaproteobacteria bacterium]
MLEADRLAKERRALDLRLRSGEAVLRSVLDHAPVAIWLLNQDGRLEFVNSVYCDALGVSADVITSAPDYCTFFDAETAAHLKTGDREAFAADGPHVSHECILFADGKKHDLAFTRIRQLDDQGIPTGKLIGIGTDVTKRKSAEMRLKLLAAVFENAREGITVSDSKGTIIEVNPRFSEITGYSREEVIGNNPRILKSGRQDEAFYKAMWGSILSDGFWRGEIWNRRKNGEIYPEILSISRLDFSASSEPLYLAVFSDISDIKSNQERLEHLAHFDALTHLPNRVLLADRLQVALSHARRNENLLAVCYLDLDGFKPINDQYGHQFGDQLLIEIAQRLSSVIRGGDSVARIGGDEFVLILGELHSLEECDVAIKRILRIIAEPYVIKRKTVKISVSIGVTLFPDDDGNVDTLLRHADQALYLAKNEGRNCYRLFDISHDQGMRARREGLVEFQVALVTNQLRLHYQPKVDMRRGQVIGAEALIRWQHPERGLLAPAFFLPSIENTEADIALGEWVIQEALRQVHSWHLSGSDFTVSVNISACHLAQENFVSRLKSFIEAYPDLPAHSLEIEILETAVLEDIALITALMNECQSFGVNFALDDFGTGYSSLSYFKRLPASTLKIDQSFIRDMLSNSDDLAIVQGIISLTSAFRRGVIAEGVETIEHGVMLLQMGCDLAQGYGIARPMPGEDFLQWQAQWCPDDAWARAASLSFTRVDIDLLMAEKNHQQWVEQLKLILLSETNGKNATIDLDRSQCRIDEWFDGVGNQQFSAKDELQEAKFLHEKFHEVSAELAALYMNGQVVEARSRIGDLEAISEEFSGSLNALMIAIAME